MTNQLNPESEAIHHRNRVARMYRDWKSQTKNWATSEFVKQLYKDDKEAQAIFKELREKDESNR